MTILRAIATRLGSTSGAALVFGWAILAARAAEPPPPPPEPPAPAPAPPSPAPPPAETAPAKTFLGYRWTDVGRARYEIRVTEETKVEAQSGSSVEIKESVVDLELEPVGREETMTWLAMRLERARLTVSPQGLQVDSAARENPMAGPLYPMPAVYEAIKEKTLRLLLTPGGRVRKVEGVEDLVAAAKPLVPDSPQRDQLLVLMLPTDAAAVARQLANIVLYLPAIEVGPGFTKQEKWPSPMGAGEVDRTLELLGYAEEGGRKTFRVRQVLSGQDLPPVPVPSQKIVVTTPRYRNEATVWIDAAIGVPVRLESTVTTEQTIRKEGAEPSSPPDMTVRATTTIATRLTALEPKAAETVAPEAPAKEPGQP